jgi:hypothetical protein
MGPVKCHHPKRRRVLNRKDMKTKKSILSILIIVLGFALPSGAEEFLGAPLMGQGKTVQKTKSRLEMNIPLSHDQVLAFYKEAFKDNRNIKFRDWKDSTYIEDDGALPWHSIAISKEEGKKGVSVTILKDNWTWIIGTLVLRYVGVFVVLMILFLSISIAGRIISRSVEKLDAKKGGA